MAEMKENHESSEKRNEVEFERKVNPDGSYAEIITDYQNKRAEIREYDAEGSCLNSAYFLISKSQIARGTEDDCIPCNIIEKVKQVH